MFSQKQKGLTMFGKQPKSKEVSKVRRAIQAGKVAGKITLAAANGLLPANAAGPALQPINTQLQGGLPLTPSELAQPAHKIEVSQTDVGGAVMQVRHANGDPGPVEARFGVDLPPPSETVVAIQGTPSEVPYTAERPDQG